MDNLFLQNIQHKVSDWRDKSYAGVEKETLNILTHIKRVGFLYQPQVEALETYVYLKEATGNKTTLEIFKSLFTNDKEILLALGLSKDEAFDLVDDKKKTKQLLSERFGKLDYPNQVYALTMGAGKTILMAAMMMYDFVLSYHHGEDKRFAKNALVFAPDKTIIESLKEIKSFDYSKILPKEYEFVPLNIKYHYLEDTETPLAPLGNYNVIVTNSQKIILKTRHKNNHTNQLFNNWNNKEKQEIENNRLFAIRKLEDLAIFVDEAHHSYGTTLEGTLKKSRKTIEYLHQNKPLINVVNLTGTPYVKNKMVDDVVYHFGLKTGIEKGILKQVRFSEFSNVKTDNFIQETVETFWSEYSENRLENKLPKIAFYASNIDELQKELKPKLEKVLAEQNIPINKVLEYHTGAEENKDEFISLDTEQSTKQFILLVGKGTEGWNCRSLVACALYRKPKSAIFVLQSSTRCLRCIGDNSTLAHIFLSQDNYKILDKELKNNFATSIEELSAQDQKSVEHTLKIEKKKKLKVKKVLKEIIAAENKDLQKIKIDFNKFSPDKYKAYIGEGGIFLENGKTAGYKAAKTTKELKQELNLTFYEIVEIINRYTHLSCLDIEIILSNNEPERGELVEKLNSNIALLPFIIQNILAQAFAYQEKVETIEEELELAKIYPFKISIDKGKNILVVYQEDEEKLSGKNRLGFHINLYNFDSADEKDLFRYLRQVLEKDESIVDIYFTGGVTDEIHNDFYFEYYSPDKKRMAKYFPDFLIETSKGRFLVLEVKAAKAKETYSKNKKQYSGKYEELFDEVFAKEIGFTEFQKVNQGFEYKIIFDASLQRQQQELLEKIKQID